jgi:hypothetical protein
MSIIRPKNNCLNVKFFESIKNLNQFDIIRKNHFHVDKNFIIEENLSQIIIELLDYQKDFLVNNQMNQLHEYLEIKKIIFLLYLIKIF